MDFNLKNIFLFDAVGALLSSMFTGLLLPLYSENIGIEIWILHDLAILPLAYAIYSFSCYRYFANPKPWMLLSIVYANVFYCLVSAALIFKLDGLTNWGAFLLTGEILVVLAVALIEIKVYRRNFAI